MCPYLSLSIGSPKLCFDTQQNILLWVSMAAYKLATVLHINWYLCTLHIPDLCTVPLYICPKYNNMAHNLLWTKQQSNKLQSQMAKLCLGWEIRSEFHGILQLIQFWTFWTPEFSSEFYFSDHKMCSCQFWTRFTWFGILSHHQFFRFHESEKIPAISIFLAC